MAEQVKQARPVAVPASSSTPPNPPEALPITVEQEKAIPPSHGRPKVKQTAAPPGGDDPGDSSEDSEASLGEVLSTSRFLHDQLKAKCSRKERRRPDASSHWRYRDLAGADRYRRYRIRLSWGPAGLRTAA